MKINLLNLYPFSLYALPFQICIPAYLRLRVQSALLRTSNIKTKMYFRWAKTHETILMASHHYNLPFLSPHFQTQLQEGSRLFHLLPSPVHHTGFFFYFFSGFLAIFILSSNNNSKLSHIPLYMKILQKQFD